MTQPKPNTMDDWLDEVLDEIYQDKNTLGDLPLDRKLAKALITARLEEVEHQAVYKFILDVPDGVYNKKGKSIVMIDLASLKGGGV